MNIVTPLPVALPFTNSNVNTDSVRRDNQLKEVIPQPSQNEESPAQGGLGSDSDKVRQPGQAPQPLVYERPQPQQQSGQSPASSEQQQKDNGEDPSAGKQDAQQQQQEQAEQREVEQLKARDREVRAHEQAHARVGGEYAGAPQYEFELGPDGQRYAVGGEVSIDISEENEPEQTVRKMEQVKAAALAPAEPSPADLRVASEATQIAARARTELANEQQQARSEAFEQVFNPQAGTDAVRGPELEDIVVSGAVTSPTRSLDKAALAPEEQQRSLEDSERDPLINQRANRINDFYARIDQPRSSALSFTA